MLDWFMVLVWVGGLKPAYDYHSSQGESKIWAAIEAFAWPIDYGMWLADIYEKDE